MEHPKLTPAEENNRKRTIRLGELLVHHPYFSKLTEVDAAECKITCINHANHEDKKDNNPSLRYYHDETHNPKANLKTHCYACGNSYSPQRVLYNLVKHTNLSLSEQQCKQALTSNSVNEVTKKILKYTEVKLEEVETKQLPVSESKPTHKSNQKPMTKNKVEYTMMNSTMGVGKHFRGMYHYKYAGKYAELDTGIIKARYDFEEDGKAKKFIIQRTCHPSNPDEWYKSSKAVPTEIPKTMPYRFEYLDTNTVYIVEGEKCVEALLSVDLNAVCAINSGKPSSTDWSVLQDKKCIIIPDADKRGVEVAQELIDCLKEVTNDIHIVDTSHAEKHYKPRKGKQSTDIADWIETDLDDRDKVVNYINDNIVVDTSVTELDLNEDDKSYLDIELLEMKEYQGRTVSKCVEYTGLMYDKETKRYVITGIELTLKDSSGAVGKCFFTVNRGRFRLETEDLVSDYYYYKTNNKSNIVIICEEPEDVDLCYKNGYSSICWRGKKLQEGSFGSMYRAITRDPSTILWVWARTVDKTKAISRAIILSCHVDVLPYQVIKQEVPKGSTNRIEVDYPPSVHFSSNAKDKIPINNNMYPLVEHGDLSGVTSRLKIVNEGKYLSSELPRTKMEYRDLVETILNMKCSQECRGASGGAIEYRDINNTNDPKAWKTPKDPDVLVSSLVSDMKLHLRYRNGGEKLKTYSQDRLMEYVNTFFQSCQVDSTKEYLLSLDPSHPEWSVPEEDLVVYRYWKDLFEDNSWPDELKEQWKAQNPTYDEDRIDKEVDDYIRYVTALTPMSMVLRTFYPGCSIKESLLFCGVQGAGKSEMFMHMLPRHLQDSKFRQGVNEMLKAEKKFYVWRNASLVEYADTVFSGRDAKLNISLVKSERRTYMYTVRVAYGKRESTFPVKCAFFRTCNPVEGVVGSDHSGTDDTLFLRTYTKCPKDKYTYFYDNKGDMRTRLWIGAIRLARKEVQRIYASGHERVSLTVPQTIKAIGDVAVASFTPDKESDFRDESELTTMIDKKIRGMVRDLEVYTIGKNYPKKKALYFEDVLEYLSPFVYQSLTSKGAIDHRNKEIQKFKSSLRTLGILPKMYHLNPQEYHHLCFMSKNFIIKYGMEEIVENKGIIKLTDRKAKKDEEDSELMEAIA